MLTNLRRLLIHPRFCRIELFHFIQLRPSNYGGQNHYCWRLRKQKMHDSNAWLVVGHGTRKPTGADQLRQLVDTMQSLRPGCTMQHCFLELASPSIDIAIAELARMSIRRIVVVPVLLFEAAHAKEDIPNAVENAARQHGIVVERYLAPIGCCAPAIELSAKRFREAAISPLASGCAGACASLSCISMKECSLIGCNLGRMGLAMVGRGTSDASALAAMRTFAEMRVSKTPVAWYGTGFFAGGSPDVDALLDQASRADCDTIVVQPHLLFEGELVDQLRSKVIAMQSLAPGKRWLITPTLGADMELAKLFVSLADVQSS